MFPFSEWIDALRFSWWVDEQATQWEKDHPQDDYAYDEDDDEDGEQPNMKFYDEEGNEYARVDEIEREHRNEYQKLLDALEASKARYDELLEFMEDELSLDVWTLDHLSAAQALDIKKAIQGVLNV